MTGFVVLAVIAVVLYFVYRAYKRGKFRKYIGGGTSAFARVAEQEGKLIALKVVNKAKKVEAMAVHAALDEIDSLLG